MEDSKYEIFASYSHYDVDIVKPMIQLLRPSYTVFLDKDAIIPGKKWMVVIVEAIQGCRSMYLFWCSHSASSPEVQKEYTQAISLEKDIVTVLIDKTPLPTELNAYQWVDLRDVIGNHGGVKKIGSSRSTQPTKNHMDDIPGGGTEQSELSSKVRRISHTALQSAAALLNNNIECRIRESQIRVYQEAGKINSMFDQLNSLSVHFKPGFGDIKPGFGDIKPGFGDINPGFGDFNNGLEDSEPQFRLTDPSRNPNFKSGKKGTSNKRNNRLTD
jgi:hypothetical protein